MFIPDPNFYHPGSRIRIKELKYFNPKKWFPSSRKYDPGCSSRILTFHPSWIPGSIRHWIPDPVPQHWFFLPLGSECAARRPRPESSSAPPAHSTLVPNPAAAHLTGAALQNMDQISIKTPNPLNVVFVD
jgi:hypothetical protein